MRSTLLAKFYVYNSGIADDSWFLEFIGLALLKLCAHGVVTPICPLPRPQQPLFHSVILTVLTHVLTVQVPWWVLPASARESRQQPFVALRERSKSLMKQ